MTTLRLPWAPIQARGEIAVVLVATPETRASGGLTTDGYALAERLGSHLRGRLDGLWCADNPGARQVARCMETPEVGPSVAHGLRLTSAPGRRLTPAPADPEAVALLRRLGANSQPGELQVVVADGELISALLEDAVGLPRWRRAPTPPAGCRTLSWTQEGRWALTSGVWMPA